MTSPDTAASQETDPEQLARKMQAAYWRVLAEEEFTWDAEEAEIREGWLAAARVALGSHGQHVMTAAPENAPAAGQDPAEVAYATFWSNPAMGRETGAKLSGEVPGVRQAWETAIKAAIKAAIEAAPGTGLYLAAIARLSAALRGVCQETGTSTMAHHIARDALADLDQPQRLPDLRRELGEARAEVAQASRECTAAARRLDEAWAERDQARAELAGLRERLDGLMPMGLHFDDADPVARCLVGDCPWHGHGDAMVDATTAWVRHLAADHQRDWPGDEDPAPASASPDAAGDGARLIAAERARQQAEEGYTPEHDQGHVHGELARAAGVYALRAAGTDGYPGTWPWLDSYPKAGTPVRMLVKAGALIAAEIDRLVAAQASPDAAATPDGER